MIRTLLMASRKVSLPGDLKEILWRIARLYGSRLIMAEVRDPLAEGPPAAQSMGDTLREPEGSGFPVKRVVLAGHFVERVCDKGHEADVIVVQSDDLVGAGDRRSTEVLAEIVRQAPRPIWVARSPYRFPEHIVVAYDGSTHSGRALHLSANMAETLGARLTVLNVDESRDGVAQELVLSRAAGYCEPYRIEMERVGVFGTAAASILAFAQSNQCDLLVLGAAGVGYLRGLLFGSVTGHLIASAPSSVLVAK